MVPGSGASDSGTRHNDEGIHSRIYHPGIQGMVSSFAVEYLCLIDMMTPIQLGVPSKTILEDVYGFTPDVESLPAVVSSLVVWRRLLGTKTDKKLGGRNVPISLVE